MKIERIKLTNNFMVDEFINPTTYKKFGGRSVMFLDPRLIQVVQRIREIIGTPIIINNWAEGGQFRESGLRTFNTKTGAAFSQHKFGRAADLKVNGMAIHQLLGAIMMHEIPLRAMGLSTIENIQHTPTWLHVDVRYSADRQINFVNP